MNLYLLYKIIIKLTLVLLLFILLIIVTPYNALAMSEAQRDLFNQQVGYYDLKEVECVATSTPALTKEQKIAQTLIVGFDSQNDAGIKAAVEKHKVGGIFPVGSGSYEKLTKEFFESLNTAAGAKLFIASDDEGGQVTRFADGYPSALDMGTLSAEQAKVKGAEMGQLLTNRGLNADLAPVLDLQTQNGFMSASQRVWSSDPARVVANAGAWAEGLKSKGITPTYKHFPGIGKLTQNTDEGKPAAVSLADLTEDLKPFRELANKHGGAVMLSNGYVAEWGEEPVGINNKAVEYLKNDIKFGGTIMTDALNVLDKHDAKYNLSTAVVAALNAGVDVPLFVGDEGGTDISKNVEDAIKAVASGVDEKRIDAAYAKSLSLRGLPPPNSNNTAPQQGASSYTTVVNKKNPLSPISYAPSDLQDVGNNWQLRKEAADGFAKMSETAKNEGLNLSAVSGYRSFATQEETFKKSETENGLEHTLKYVAKPGYSEHQMGLAIDINSTSPEFANTPESTWLVNNAQNFGFILRYPNGKQDITGYEYEPWHWRYIGKDEALKFKNSGKTTLEEFYNIPGGTEYADPGAPSTPSPSTPSNPSPSTPSTPSTSPSAPSTDLTGFDPDPAAIEYYEKTQIQDGKTMKQIIEELKPLYVKAAAAAGLADWEMLPALHNLEFNLGRNNPTTNVTFRTPFQMGETYLANQGYNISEPKFQPGHQLTDEEFTEVATIAAKGWIIPDAAGQGFDATRGLTPEEAARTAVAYKSGGGSVWLNGTLDFKGHAYAWAGYNKNEFKLPMAYAPGSPYGDEQPENKIDKPGVATLFALLKKYSGGSTQLTGNCKCSPDLSNGATVFLDPGHGGDSISVDPETGLKDIEYMNEDEAKDVWKIANDAKAKLEEAGYKVILSKSSVDEVANFREKSNRANASKASIGVSIHTTGGTTDYTWGQSIGAYRDYLGKKIEFSDQAVADKSQQFVSTFNTVRATTEKVNPSTEYVSYDHVKELGGSGGNLALIMLWAKIPWVYLEKATGTPPNENRPLTEQEIKDYTATVVEGVKKTVPTSGTSTGSVGCSSSGSAGINTKTFVDTLKAFVWEDGAHSTNKKPAYKEAVDRRKTENKYVGADGIDCGGFVTTLMQESGQDAEYGGGGPTGTQQKYLDDNATKYQKLGILEDNTKLIQGDIAIWNAGGASTQGNAGHTYIYTDKVDGFKGNSAQANLGSEAPYSMDAYFPKCDRELQSYCQQFTWYRLLK